MTGSMVALSGDTYTWFYRKAALAADCDPALSARRDEMQTHPGRPHAVALTASGRVADGAAPHEPAARGAPSFGTSIARATADWHSPTRSGRLGVGYAAAFRRARASTGGFPRRRPREGRASVVAAARPATAAAGASRPLPPGRGRTATATSFLVLYTGPRGPAHRRVRLTVSTEAPTPPVSGEVEGETEDPRCAHAEAARGRLPVRRARDGAVDPWPRPPGLCAWHHGWPPPRLSARYAPATSTGAGKRGSCQAAGGTHESDVDGPSVRRGGRKGARPTDRAPPTQNGPVGAATPCGHTAPTKLVWWP